MLKSLCGFSEGSAPYNERRRLRLFLVDSRRSDIHEYSCHPFFSQYQLNHREQSVEQVVDLIHVDHRHLAEL